MKVLLINLPRYKGTPVVREERCELVTKMRVDTPTTLLIMASLLRNRGYEADLIDANGRQVISRRAWLLACSFGFFLALLLLL